MVAVMTIKICSIQRKKADFIWYCTWRNQKIKNNVIIHIGVYPTDVKRVLENWNSHPGISLPM